MKTKTLSRLEVSRRISALTVTPWRDLSGSIDGCQVNAWTAGPRRRVERVHVCAIPGQGGTAAAALKLAKQIERTTGLCVHFHGGRSIAGTIINGTVCQHPTFAAPRGRLP